MVFNFQPEITIILPKERRGSKGSKGSKKFKGFKEDSKAQKRAKDEFVFLFEHLNI
jgi:hypothetical protein